MIASPYSFFQSLSREIGQMQTDYRNLTPLDSDGMQTAIKGLRQNYVPFLTDGAFANQLAIVRGHGKEGFMTVVLDSEPRALTFYSRFAIPVLSPDYKSNPYEYWEFVLETGQKIRDAGKIPVLTVGDAEWLLDSMIACGLEKLNEVFVFNQDYQQQQHLMDKFLQYERAHEAGVEMPRTWLADEAFWTSKPDLPYPVLVKERRGKRHFSITGLQAFDVGSWEHLIQIKKEFDPEADFIVQEKVSDEGNEKMFSIGAYRDRKSRMSVMFSSRRMRSTREFGSTALSVSESCPEGLELAEHYLNHIDYYGSCELEFIYSSDQKKLLLLELNPRLYKTQSLATHCGINLNYCALLNAMDKTLPEMPTQIYGPRWWLTWGDIAAGIRKMGYGEMSLGEFMAPLSFDIINGIDELDDPLPGFVNLFNGKY
jgi:D-aspartate ligase